MKNSLKKFTTINEQIALLESRGMQFGGASPEQWLNSVGYYRLSGYWYPYRHLLEAGGRSKRFQPDTHFDDIVQLYEFDRKLRTLLHDAIERVEVALRSHVSYHIGAIDPLAHHLPETFRPNFDHASWLRIANQRIGRARRHSPVIQHHDSKYDGRLPIWAHAEFLDFSDLSRLYEGLPASAQWTVAANLGIELSLSGLSKNQRVKAKKRHPLVSVFEQLTIVRNSAAHHARVWNRSYAPVGTTALRTVESLSALPEAQSEQIYGAIILIASLLENTSPGSTWKDKVADLIQRSFSPVRNRSVAEMGFPLNWTPISEPTENHGSDQHD